MDNTFSSYGNTFQLKILSSLISDSNFFHRISEILLPTYFESESKQFIYNVIRNTYDKYNIAPTKDIFKIATCDISDEALQMHVITHLKDVLNYIGSEDLDAIKDETIIFCRRQKVKNAFEDGIILYESGRYDEILSLFEEASKAGLSIFEYYDYKSEIDSRYQEDTRYPIPTSWTILNEITQGGLGGGELGVLVASAGAGKSWGLINIGAQAIREGKTVFHFTLELQKEYVSKRYDAHFCSINFEELKYHINDIKSTISKLPGKLIIEFAPSGTLTINQIKAYIDKSIINGIKPDLIIVDYADLIKGTGKYAKTELRHELSNIYIELRGLAGIYNTPVWTASQSNRAGAKADVIEGTDVAEDYSKIMTADLVISLQRKLANKLGGTGIWHIIKNRFGPDGMTYPSEINTSIGLIQIYDTDSVKGKDVNRKIQNGEEVIRKSAAQKYNEFKKNENKDTKLTKFN